jgi:hypothetical protein
MFVRLAGRMVLFARPGESKDAELLVLCPRPHRTPRRCLDHPAGPEPAHGPRGTRQPVPIRGRAGQFTAAFDAVPGRMKITANSENCKSEAVDTVLASHKLTSVIPAFVP